MFYRNALLQLEKWSQKDDRKPLILRGARQVGKTSLVRMFADKFEHFVELNLEIIEDRDLFSEQLNIDEIVKSISLKKNSPLSSGRALLFIDEIQNSTYAISMLRYLYEQYKNLYVIAAGSLLESLIGREQISFPVGRVNYLFMHPVTFEEFLKAKQNPQLIDVFSELPIPAYTHEILLQQFHEYAMLGGMPEVISNWLQTEEIMEIHDIFRDLISSYHDDITKYARNVSMVEVIRHSIDSIPLEAGKRITFQGFGNSNYRSREIGEALGSLQKAMLIELIYPTTSIDIPIIPNKNKKPRLQFLDTGLINYSVGLFDKFIGIKDISPLYKGRIIEHLVGQELKALLSQRGQHLSFWVREKKQSQAEIDFLISYKGMLIPIETKSGSTGKLRSLHQFMENSTNNFAVRLYAGKFQLQEIKLPTGKVFTLLNLPYYLTSKIFSYLDIYLK